MNPGLQIPDEGMTLEELSDFVGMQMKRLGLVLKNLDGLNIVDIKFELQGGAYIQLNRKGLTFFDGTDFSLITDINGNVTLKGTVTASTVIGSEIMTKEEGVYPRAAMSSANNLFSAEASATDSVKIMATGFGEALIELLGQGVTGQIFPQLGKLLIQTAYLNGDIQISSGENVELFTGFDASHKVKLANWGKLYSNLDSKTLQQEIDNLQNQITDLDDRVTALGG